MRGRSVVSLIVVAAWMALTAAATGSRPPAAAAKTTAPKTAKAKATPKPVTTITTPLRHAGRWLVDASGRVVITHGLNMVAKRPPYLPSRLGFGADDARWIRAQGFTSVRLGVIASGVAPTPSGIDEAYLDGIAATVRTLHAAGLATLVDLHQDYYTESTAGEGFPGWLVRDRLGLARLGIGRRDAAPFDGLWGNDGSVQDDIAHLWTVVAARLRDVQGIIGYDLFNEPYPGSRADECANVNGCRSFDEGTLRPFFARLIAAVRAADPDRLVFVEPGVSFNQGAPTFIGDLGDDRTGFSFHVYCSPVPGAPGCDVRRPAAFANAERQAAAGGEALLLTEFGATDDRSRLTAVMDAADRAMVGWIEWAYFNEGPCCARPREGLVRTLAEPPRAGHREGGQAGGPGAPHPGPRRRHPAGLVVGPGGPAAARALVDGPGAAGRRRLTGGRGRGLTGQRDRGAGGCGPRPLARQRDRRPGHLPAP